MWDPDANKEIGGEKAMQWKNLASLCLMVLGLSMTRWAMPLKQDNPANHDPDSQTNSLSLTLSTDKQTYVIDEPIQFTLALRNTGSNGLWVGKVIDFADIPGAFVMSVTDGQGRPMRGDFTYFAGSLGDFSHEDLFQWIRETRLVLGPGSFLGRTAKLQDFRYDMGTAGKYKLQVSYTDIGYKEIHEEGASNKKIQEAKKAALFPLWSGTVKSPEVWIEVVR